MNARPHIATIFAIAVILASFVTLAVIFVVTSRPRAVIGSTVQVVTAGEPATTPQPRLSKGEALRKGDIDTVRQHMSRCLENGSCDLDKDLRTAAAASEPTIAKALIAAGARVNAADQHHETALHTAASRGRAGMAEVLIEAGADVGARDDEGLTPLHTAAAWGHVELTAMLLEAGADANAGDRQKQTPLHLVAARRVPPLSGYADVARKLLASGARINARSSDGTTPLGLAVRSALRLSLDGNLKATGDANEVVTVLRAHGGHE